MTMKIPSPADIIDGVVKLFDNLYEQNWLFYAFILIVIVVVWSVTR